MSERWLPVVGYEELYEVSDQGRVRSLERDVLTEGGPQTGWRINRRRERVLKPAIRKGYAGVCLVQPGERRGRVWRVHRLMLLAFVGPPPDDAATLACHRDGDHSRNVLDNLYWGTPQQNSNDRDTHGNTPRGEAHSSAKLTEAQVREIKYLFSVELFHEQDKHIAEAYGVPPQIIKLIKSGRTWRHVV